jgi:hypothetical protein
MRAGTWNLLAGLVAMVMAWSGGFTLIGTNSSNLLGAGGALLSVIGLVQLLRKRPS